MKNHLISGIATVIMLLITLSSAAAGYRSTLNKWTKGGNLYAFETLDAKLLWKATILVDDVIKAQRSLLAEKKLNDAVPEPKGVSFFVSFYTKDELKSAWKFFLDSNGKEIEAESVVPVTITPTEKVFYPYLNRWSKAYLVNFPGMELGTSPRLIVRSIVGESRLTF